jgi:hypothetical protein
MAKTDFQIQSESGQLWTDLLAWRDAAIASASAPLNESINVLTENLAESEKKCEAILAKVNDGEATKEDIIAEVVKDEKSRRVEELTKRHMALLSEVSELEDEIANLSTK